MEKAGERGDLKEATFLFETIEKEFEKLGTLPYFMKEGGK